MTFILLSIANNTLCGIALCDIFSKGDKAGLGAFILGIPVSALLVAQIVVGLMNGVPTGWFFLVVILPCGVVGNMVMKMVGR